MKNYSIMTMRSHLSRRLKSLYWGYGSEYVEWIGSVRRHGLWVKREYGKSVVRQILEMVRLRYGRNKLLGYEYYDYRLYDDAAFPWEEKRAFLGDPGGSAGRKIAKTISSGPWTALANDKVVSYAAFSGMGLPIPATVALLHPYRRFGSAQCLQTPEEAADYLRRNATYPLIVKPIYGIFSKHVSLFESFDSQCDQVVLSSGEKTPVVECVKSLSRMDRRGLIFQEVLKPHPSIAEISGQRLCGLRLLMIAAEREVVPYGALLKIPVGTHVADNYWRAGNIMARIDLESGVVDGAVTGKGPSFREVEVHPDTGRKLADLSVPDWEFTMELGLQAAYSFPGLRMQAWDIALTDRGPVFLEVNVMGSFNLPQIAYGKGLFQGTLRAFLESRGYR